MTRVAIAHEWLIRYAGSERVVEQLRVAYPDASILTTVAALDGLPDSLATNVTTSWLQHAPGWRTHHEWFLPAMPLAWRLLPTIEDVDVVVTSAHACANTVRVAPDIPILSYCHTPMRYAWDFESEQERFPALIRPAARVAMRGFRERDRIVSRRVTSFIANSSAVARRISSNYGRSALVIPPPVDTEFYCPAATEERNRDTFLYVGRLVGYKRPDLVIDAFAALPHFRLLVVGEGGLRQRLEQRATSNVEFLGSVDAQELRRLYRSCSAMVYPAVEDFGIAMAEAQACGMPVISVRQGGAVDIVEHGRTGWLIRVDSSSELIRAIERAAEERLDGPTISAQAQRFSSENFRESIRMTVDELLSSDSRTKR